VLTQDLPPWSTIYQQTQHGLAAQVLESLAHALRHLLRVAEGR
jgi:hypothetical protein